MANFHKYEWFIEQLTRHHEWAKKELAPNEIIAVLYTGSGNYACDDEDSDCDSWIIYFDKNYDPKTYQVNQVQIGDEVTWTCDIRAFIYGCLHGNWAYLIALFTKYAIINSRYTALWSGLYHYRDKIAYANPEEGLDEMSRYMITYYTLLLDEACNKPHKKAYYIRLIDFLRSAYINGQDLSTCFYNDDIGEQLREIKQSRWSLDEYIAYSKHYIDKLYNTQVDKYKMYRCTPANAQWVLQLLSQFVKLGEEYDYTRED